MTWVFVAVFCLASMCGQINENQVSGEACLKRIDEFHAHWDAMALERSELKFTGCGAKRSPKV